jgi:CheY-like chemotaxis protein
VQQPPRQRILWADDQIDLLKPHIIFLQEKGYIVTGVPNGDDALALLEQEQYDLVLLDEMMPGMDGLETLAELRRFRSDIPVIMITKSEGGLRTRPAIRQDFSSPEPAQIFSDRRLFEGRASRRASSPRTTSPSTAASAARTWTAPTGSAGWK